MRGRKELLRWNKNLKKICAKKIKRININSLRNNCIKLDILTEQNLGNLDFLVLSETKLESFFSIGHFKIPGYASPFRLGRNSNDGGIIVFVQEESPAKFLPENNKPTKSF